MYIFYVLGHIPTDNMNTAALVAFAFAVSFTTAESLSCAPCHTYKHQCTPKDQLNCKGGYTLGICHCCTFCAKIEGEKCGGTWNYYGKCDVGLKCVTAVDSHTAYILDIPGICRPENSEA